MTENNARQSELEQVNNELLDLQQSLRELASIRAGLQGDSRREDELREVEAKLAASRARRDALQDRRIQLQRERAQAAGEIQGAAAQDQERRAARRRVRTARPRPAPSRLRSLALVLAIAAATAALLGGGVYLVTTFLLVPTPIAGTAADSASTTEAPSGVSVEERLIALYLALNRDRLTTPAGADPAPVVFTVEPGENAATIAAGLEQAGLIRDAQLFRLLLRYRGADQSLEAGTFQLSRTMTMDEIIIALQQGRLEEISVTIPEGWRSEQIAVALEEQGLFPATEYLAMVGSPSRFDYDFLEGLPPGATLEGFLFPDTYHVVKEQVTAESFVRMQLETFNQRLTPELRRVAQERGITLYQAVTLASIVEREAVVPEERSLIAGVFLNRWRDGMLLNADPTVQYALGRQNGQWWKRPLLLGDLEVQSPYNTYKVPGLPPGPICNPGADALRATITAPPTDYYYFVARGDGSGTHVFARTLEEHQRNVAREQPRN